MPLHRALQMLATGAAALLLAVPPSGAQDMHDAHAAKAGAAKMMTKAQKIASAASAAPASISAKATVLDWPEKEGGAMITLRQGSNGWTCLPDMPNTEGIDPACLDAVWMKWVEAYVAHKTPEISGVGFGYMTAPGGAAGSNTDPFAMKATADNHWGHHQPHIMILVPDTKTLAATPTDPANGGPYVMWAGTPYAHIMAPVSARR